MTSRPSWLQKIYWTRFAKPVEERELYRQLLNRPIASVLEVGVGDGRRMRQIAKLAQLPAGVDVLRYIGTDEFESAQDDSHHLSLKQAHQIAGSLGLKASLIPGNDRAALPRVAHKLGTSDLIIADGCLDPSSSQALAIGEWLHHLAHEQTVILGSTHRGEALQAVDLQQLEIQVSRAA